jgi:hypothetical protein
MDSGVLAATKSFDTQRAVSLGQAGRFEVADGIEPGLDGVVSAMGST